MKKLVILLLSIFCVLFVVGCGEPEPVNTYYITFKQNGQKNIIKEVLEGESLTDIPSPTPKTGYIITWDTEDFSNITEDKTVNAIETAKKFTVDYDENGGIEIEKTTEVTYGELFNLETTSRDGYVFAGYELLGHKVTSPVWFYDTQASEVTVKLLWNYRITFKQTGYEDVVVELAENEQITSEQIPTPKTRTGYQVSWSVQDFSSVTSNTTVNCIETPNKYKIYYDQITADNIPSGVEVLTDSQGKYYYEVTFDQPFDKSMLFTPVIPDQTLLFDYWKGLEVVNQPTWKLTEDITITPTYRDNTYKWHFVVGDQETYISIANGKTLDKNNESIPSLPQTDGYITEWDTKFWEISSVGGTVRVKITPIKYKVTFSVGANETVESSSKEFSYGEPYSINNNATHEDGRIFVCWAYKGEKFTEHAEAWTLLPESGTSLVDPTTGEHIPVEITLTPIWNYSVTFIVSPSETIVRYVEIDGILTDIPPVYEHQQYKYEWNYDFSKPITQNTVVETKEKVIKVTLDANGGTLLVSTLNVNYGRGYTLPDVEFDGYVFDGWYYNQQKIESSGIWNIEIDSLTLTAQRGEPIVEEPTPITKYYVTFKQNGQQEIVKEVLEGESLTDIPTPASKVGYVVTWDVTDFSNITKNLMVNAVERAKTFTIIYDECGGEEITTTTTVTFDDTFNLQSTPRNGYVLAGYEIDGQKITSPIWTYDFHQNEITVKLLWNYQITFKQTGSSDVVVELPENQMITPQQIPTPKNREGYQVSWSVKDFSSLTANTTVTCIETPNKYKIYYDQISEENIPSGVQVLVDSQDRYYYEVTYDAPFNKEDLLKPIIPDQTRLFESWQGLDRITQDVWKLTEDITITPTYKDNYYTWVFMVDGVQKTLVNVAIGQSLAKDYSLIPQLPQTDGHITEWDTKFWEITSGGGIVNSKITPIKYRVTFQVGENETVEFATKEFVYGMPYEIDNEATNDTGKTTSVWEYKNEIFPKQGDSWTLLPEEGTVLVDPITGEHIPVEITFKSVYKWLVTFKSPAGDEYREVYSNHLLTDIPEVYRDEQNLYRYEWDYDFTKPITGDTVIELREKVIKVTLIANGGTVSTTYLEVRYGREYTLPTARFKNFEFDGWLYEGEIIKSSGIWDIDVDSIVLTAKRGAYFTGNY